jgi:hypothetical protein
MGDKILQKLPNPLIREDGTTAASPQDWLSRRPQIEELVVGTEYGGMPPKPEEQYFERLNSSINGTIESYRITAGAGGRRLGFEIQLVIPPHEKDARLPVVLSGDGCYRFMNDQVIDAVNARGFIAAKFNRTAIVHDVYTEAEARQSPLYTVYPDIASGSIAGWAWGYQRCIDMLVQLPFVDPEYIGITGLSRGGKTVLLAAATDERVAFTAPACSGAGGVSCWRYIQEDPSNKEDGISADLAYLLPRVPHWFGPGMREFKNHEERIPFDQHYLTALVAPRYCVLTEGFEDFHSAPKGSYQTLMAVRAVYRLLGAPDRILARYRDGGHLHTPEDFEVLLNVMSAAKNGTPQNKAYYANPYPDMEKIFDWD